MMNIINRKARFNYSIIDKYEAGIKLKGTEIKSIREGSCDISDAYIVIKNKKPIILNMYVGKYSHGNIYNHDERRSRELLLHKHQILKLEQRVKLDRISLIPLRAYFVNGLLKIEFGICKGKNLIDKRETIKKRDLEREK